MKKLPTVLILILFISICIYFKIGLEIILASIIGFLLGILLIEITINDNKYNKTEELFNKNTLFKDSCYLIGFIIVIAIFIFNSVIGAFFTSIGLTVGDVIGYKFRKK